MENRESSSARSDGIAALSARDGETVCVSRILLSGIRQASGQLNTALHQRFPIPHSRFPALK